MLRINGILFQTALCPTHFYLVLDFLWFFEQRWNREIKLRHFVILWVGFLQSGSEVDGNGNRIGLLFDREISFQVCDRFQIDFLDSRLIDR